MSRGKRGTVARILVVGLGYVGLMSSIGLAKLGHDVTGIDISESRVKSLKEGSVPFYEPVLGELLSELTQRGAISWVENNKELDNGDFEFAFVCVSTPSGPSGSADTSMVEEAVNQLKRFLPQGSIIVIRSTVPIGTSLRYLSLLEPEKIQLAYNPEFLSEGTAVKDFFNPERIVVGAEEASTAARVLTLYEGLDAPTVVCDLTSAETVKHASNSFLALRLSFVNELAMLCKAAGANYMDVSRGMGMDSRIGMQFLNPGPGWGGSCFPKDTLELVATAKKLGSPMTTIEAAVTSNQLHMANSVRLVSSALGGDLAGKVISVWGLSFKAGTDDIRDSPAVAMAEELVRQGAIVKSYDPMAKAPASLALHQKESAIDACANAIVLLVLADWPEFSNLSAKQVSEAMEPDAHIFDFRNVLDEVSWKSNFNNFWRISS
jgi:UDPglucose 6-dehydrogenase